MATRKTTKKPSAAPKKTTAVRSSVKVSSAKSSVGTMKDSPKKGITVSDLQKKVMDPKNKRSLVIALVVVGLVLIAYFGKSFVVAALVNGQPVPRLSVVQDLEKQYGKAALDSVISKMLVMQEADKKNITATEGDIKNEISKIEKQFKEQGQDLNSLLTMQGLSQEKFKDEVKIQILVTKLLGDKAKVTDKEFNDFLDKNKDLITSEKDEAKAKAALKQQMEQQKLGQKYQEWISEIRKKAKIQYFVNY